VMSSIGSPPLHLSTSPPRAGRIYSLIVSPGWLKRLVVPVACALFFVASSRSSVAQVTFNLYVDALNGSASGTGTLLSPFDSVRTALGHVDPSFITVIHVIGRWNAVAGTPKIHDDSVESWGSTMSALLITPKIKVRWDSLHSDNLPFPLVGKVPVIFSGAGTSQLDPTRFTAFQIRAPGTTPVTAANVLLENLQIVAFDVGVDMVLPASSVEVSPKIDGLTFNQCEVGMKITVSFAVCRPTVLNCKFLNQVQDLGGGTSFVVNVVAHLQNQAGNSGNASGTFSNCTFRSGRAPPMVGQPHFVGIGFQNDAAGSSAMASPVITNCKFRGNSLAQYTSPGFYGMRTGLQSLADGGRTDFQVDNCWFGSCGYDGILIVAQGQSVVMFNPDGSVILDDPPEHLFLTPSITNTTLWKNGRIANLLPTPLPDTGHGIATRTLLMGLLKPTIATCVPGLAGLPYPTLGITQNYFAGVYIHSEIPPEVALPGAGVMRATNNNTIVSRSEVYNNVHDGVSVYLERASGRPLVERNRIYHNDSIGIRTYGANTNEGIEPYTDEVFCAPVTINNFIYNTNNPGFTRQQDFGIFDERRVTHVGGRDNLNGPVGNHFNTITNQVFYAWDLLTEEYVSQQHGYCQGNIFYYTQSMIDVPQPDRGFCRWSCGKSLPAGNGNISVLPQLVSYLTGDLHLAIVAMPPCKDLALEFFPNYDPDPTNDFDGEPRPKINTGSNFDADIGADEAF